MVLVGLAAACPRGSNVLCLTGEGLLLAARLFADIWAAARLDDELNARGTLRKTD